MYASTRFTAASRSLGAPPGRASRCPPGAAGRAPRASSAASAMPRRPPLLRPRRLHSHRCSSQEPTVCPFRLSTSPAPPSTAPLATLPSTSSSMRGCTPTPDGRSRRRPRGGEGRRRQRARLGSGEVGKSEGRRGRRARRRWGGRTRGWLLEWLGLLGVQQFSSWALLGLQTFSVPRLFRLTEVWNRFIWNRFNRLKLGS